MNSPDRPVAYLDHAATTPIYPEVIDAMAAQMGRLGNASSLHGSGRDARRVVEESRETIAAASRRPPLRGRVHLRRHRVRQPRDQGVLLGPHAARTTGACASCRPRSSTTPMLDPLHWLATAEARRGRAARRSTHDGRLDLAALAYVDRARSRSRSRSITVMWANNEVGTIQPIDEVVALAPPHGIPVHTDAVQALGQVPIDFAASGVDAMTVTGHKIGGPFGVGALLLRREAELVALLHGGGQERDVRSGTIDAPAIVGFARRDRAGGQGSGRARRSSSPALRDDLIAGVLDGRTRRSAQRRDRRRYGCRATRTCPSPAARATRC